MAVDRKRIFRFRLLSKKIAQKIFRHLRTEQQPFQDAAEDHSSSKAEYGEQKIESAARQTLHATEKLSQTMAHQTYGQFQVVSRNRHYGQVVEPEFPSGTTKPVFGAKSRTQVHTSKKHSKFHERTSTKWQSQKKQYAQQKAIQKHLQQKSKQTGTQILSSSGTSIRSVHPHAQSLFQNLRNIGHFLLQKGKLLLIAATKSAVTALLALGSTGIVVTLTVIFFAIIILFFSSPLGILFANETSDPNSIPIFQIVGETNTRFEQDIEKMIASHPECSEVKLEYESSDNRTWKDYWPEILALFAVDSNINLDTMILVIDSDKKQLIEDMFHRMHTLESWIETIEIPSPNPNPDEDVPNRTPQPPQYQYILHIKVSSRSVASIAEELHFTDREHELLDILLSDEILPYLTTLYKKTHDKALFNLK